MNKYSIITLIAIIAIIIPFAYSILNIYTAGQLQYRWSDYNKFNYFELSNNGDVEFCNTLPYWSRFEKFEINAFYDSENKGTFTIKPLAINPLSHTIQHGIFYSNEFTEAQYLFMQLDFEFNGGPIRLDPNKMNVIVNIDTPIIGVIPYSTSIQYSGFDFNQIMNGKNFDC
jgi:hypothetical protein